MLNGQYSQGTLNPQNPYGRPAVYQWTPNPLHPMASRQPPYVQPPYHVAEGQVQLGQQQSQQSQQNQQSLAQTQQSGVYQYSYQPGPQQNQQQPGQSINQQSINQQAINQQSIGQPNQQSISQPGQPQQSSRNSWQQQQPTTGNSAFMIPETSSYNTAGQSLYDMSSIRPGPYTATNNPSSRSHGTSAYAYGGGAPLDTNASSHYVSSQYYNINTNDSTNAGYFNPQIALPPPQSHAAAPPHINTSAARGKQGFDDSLGRQVQPQQLQQQQQQQQQQEQQHPHQPQQLQVQQIQPPQVYQQPQQNLQTYQQALPQNLQHGLQQNFPQNLHLQQNLPQNVQQENYHAGLQNQTTQQLGQTNQQLLQQNVARPVERQVEDAKPVKKPRKSRKSTKKQDIEPATMDTSALTQQAHLAHHVQQQPQSVAPLQVQSQQQQPAVSLNKPTIGQSASPASDRSEVAPIVGATEVDHLMLIIQAQEKHAEKMRRGEVSEPFKLDDELKLLPSQGSLNGGVGKRSTDNVLKYKCNFPDCDKSFSQKTHLEIHGRSHTGERPYVCDFEGCGKRFSQRGNLRTHRRSHTGEKPYKCDICGKQFAQRGNFRAHKLIHENYRPFVCKLDKCNKTFTQLGNLKAHQNKFHQDTVNSLTQKFKYYGANQMNMIPAEEMEVFKYFADLYKNSNRGIKGRGKNSKIVRTYDDKDTKSMSQSPGAMSGPGQQQEQIQPKPVPPTQYQYPPLQGQNQMLGQTLFQGENPGQSLQFQMGY